MAGVISVAALTMPSTASAASAGTASAGTALASSALASPASASLAAATRQQGSAGGTHQTDAVGEARFSNGMRQYAAKQAVGAKAAQATAARAAAAKASKAAAAKAASKKAAAKRAAVAEKRRAAAASSGSPRQIARALLGKFSWSGSQFSCLEPLWGHESSWSVSASNPGSGAYGIPQALPGSKMSSAGPDWQTSAETQIKWGLQYIQGTYGSPCAAWSHEESAGWY